MTHARHFVFAGGGSGGHLTPSIAVAEQLLDLAPDSSVNFLTSGRKIDRVVLGHSSLDSDERCQVTALPVTQPPRPRISVFRDSVALWQSIIQSRKLLRRQPASVLMATGAFAAVPGLIAARQFKVPIALFEANAIPGRVNRWWSRHAAAKFSGWSEDEKPLTQEFEFVGMPTICGNDGTPKDANALPNHRQLLIVGGSQGSRRLNDLVVSAISKSTLPPDWSVLHQTGVLDRPDIWSAELRDRVTTTDFINGLPQKISESTMVISRAGAVTISEITAAGRPSILVPLRSSSEDHQQANAQRLAKAGAAITIDECNPRAEQELASALQSLLTDEESRIRMQEQSRTLHRPGAASHIARRLIELAEQCETD